MQTTESPRAEGFKRLYELMRRVNSSTDLSEVLDEIARGVVEDLGYGIAAIARLEGDMFVMTTVAGPDDVREQIIGRRTPVASIFNEFAQADEWGVLRFVPHDRMPDALEESAWVPDFEPDSSPDAWHPLDALYAPLHSATGQLLGNMSVDLPPGNRVPNKQQRELLEMFVVQAGLAMYNAQQRERLGDQVRMGEMLRSVSYAGQIAELDQSLYEAAQAVAKGPADRAPVDPVLPDRRPRPRRGVRGLPAGERRDAAASWSSSRATSPAGPGSWAGRSRSPWTRSPTRSAGCGPSTAS